MKTLNKIYSGIGSRKTPPEILSMMTQIAAKLHSMGYHLRTGDAWGADEAFRNGTSNLEVFGPQDATPQAIDFTSAFHPAWKKLNEYERKLHGRNAQIILGRDLDLPSDFVICWTLNGEFKGGTGQGLRISNKMNVPIFNLALEASRTRLEAFLQAI